MANGRLSSEVSSQQGPRGYPRGGRGLGLCADPSLALAWRWTHPGPGLGWTDAIPSTVCVCRELRGRACANTRVCAGVCRGPSAVGRVGPQGRQPALWGSCHLWPKVLSCQGTVKDILTLGLSAGGDSEGAGENLAPCAAGRPPPPPRSDVLFVGLGSFGPACTWPLRRGCSGDEGHQILECVAQGLGGWMQKLG